MAGGTPTSNVLCGRKGGTDEADSTNGENGNKERNLRDARDVYTARLAHVTIKQEEAVAEFLGDNVNTKERKVLAAAPDLVNVAEMVMAIQLEDGTVLGHPSVEREENNRNRLCWEEQRLSNRYWRGWCKKLGCSHHRRAKHQL